jgi:hypothetical protein
LEKADSEEEDADQLLPVLLAVVVLAKINTNMRSQIIPSTRPTMSYARPMVGETKAR